MVFSTRFMPMRAELFLKAGKLVRTVTVAEALSPLVCPVAVTVCARGWADLGTSNACGKLPALSAVAEPADDVSNTRLTVSGAAKPEPLAVALVFGEPDAGEVESEAARA